jgi:ABC-type xylose transport system permease subunit
VNCDQAICSLTDADWYLDLTGWHGPVALTVVACIVVGLVARWLARWWYQ